MPFLSFLAWKTVQVRFIRILQHHIRSSRLIQMDKSCLDSHHINGSIQKPHQIHVNDKSTFRPNEFKKKVPRSNKRDLNAFTRYQTTKFHTGQN